MPNSFETNRLIKKLEVKICKLLECTSPIEIFVTQSVEVVYNLPENSIVQKIIVEPSENAANTVTVGTTTSGTDILNLSLVDDNISVNDVEIIQKINPTIYINSNAQDIRLTIYLL